MAKLTSLPSIDIINAFKGVLDFYLWRGIPCVRRWPRYRPASRSAPAIASAALFGLIVQSYSLLAGPILAALREAAADNPRTARDIHVSGVLGHLHEASMSDFLTLLQESRDFLDNLTALLGALHSVDTDELVVNVDLSVLPTGAATAAHQITQNTSLTTIAKLETALASVATDRLKVKGEDQLLSIHGIVAEERHGTISGAGGFYDSDPVPAGHYWVITQILAMDADSPTTAHGYYLRHDAADYLFHYDTTGWALNVPSDWSGHVYLDAGDVIRVSFVGALAGDTVHVNVVGYQMTLET